jgi:hypothetical protein
MNEYEKHLGVWKLGARIARHCRLHIKLGVLATLLLIPIVIASMMLVQRENERVGCCSIRVE